MATAHRSLLKLHFGIRIPPDAINAAMQGNLPLLLVVQMNGEGGAVALSHGCGRVEERAAATT
jgi:hypothetical protein